MKYRPIIVTFTIQAITLALLGCSSLNSGVGSVVYSVNPKDIVPRISSNWQNPIVTAESTNATSCATSNTAAGAMAVQPLDSGGVQTMALKGILRDVINKSKAVRSAANLYAQSKSSSEAPDAAQPEDITYGDFIDLPGLLKQMSEAGDRTAFYELQYFKGHFVDHFGNAIVPSQITEKNQDQEIQNLLTVFLESVFDDIEEYQFEKSGKAVPYWVSQKPAGPAPAGTAGNAAATDSYYYLSGKSMGTIPTLPITPGASTAPKDFGYLQNLALINPNSNVQVPTFIAYAYYQYYMAQYPDGTLVPPNSYNLSVTSLDLDTGAQGCGMTQTKADVLLYLSRRAGTLTGGEAGALLGLLGGANVGPVIVLGKISIGDNQTLKAVVQAFLSETAERVTAAAARQQLLKVAIPNNSGFSAVLDTLSIQKKPGTASSSKTASLSQ